MKVVLTGSTGHIGSQAVKQCLAEPQIDSIVILSRRELPQYEKESKLRIIVMKDFTNYSTDTIDAIADTDASIWCLGSRYGGDDTTDIEYPKAFFDAITSAPPFATRSKPLHHVHLFGALVETDQNKSLWFMPQARKARVSVLLVSRPRANEEQGKAQTEVMKYTHDSNSRGLWKTFILKPGGVLPAKTEAYFYHHATKFMLGRHLSIWNDELAAVMLDLAIHGGSETVLYSNTISERGQKLVSQ